MEKEISEITAFTTLFNELALHPLQSWQWGEFREKTGVNVFRFGEYNNKKLSAIYQLTLHKIPKTRFFVGYIPKSIIPSVPFLEYLKNFLKDKNVVFVKFEPNVEKENGQVPNLLIRSKRPLFTKYTFQLDISKSESELLSQMKSKTRYNVRLAEKKGVKVEEDNSDESFQTYLKLQEETTKRQGFYAHNQKYHQLLWETLYPAKIAHILTAKYENEILVSWMVFLFNNILYYPYGGSSDKYRNLMPSNLMLYKAAIWGKSKGAKLFDLWGALGSDPNPNDPWIGFHKFKEGYTPRHVEFIGSYDFVLKPTLYKLYNIADSIRWSILRLKK